MRIAVTSVSDKGLILNRSSVDLNEVVAVQQMLLGSGIDAKILDRDKWNDLKNFDALFIKFGTIINWGGQQSEYLKAGIRMINNFDGPVFMLAVDQDFRFPNKPRAGFELINRPVYFLYTGANASGVVDKVLNGVDVIKSVQFNHCVQIGKEISKLPFIDVKPKYDAIYGGQARRELIPLINRIAEKYSVVTYGKMSKKTKNTVHLITKDNFDNEEIRAVNSLGKHSFIFYKPRTPWLTPRIFEQLDSNSMVLFDKRWKATEPFWTDKNTFSSHDELMELMKYEPTENDIKEQHQLSLSFDYDKYNEEQMSHIIQFLE